jgi:outer membrane receptor protein involved in Fe transport
MKRRTLAVLAGIAMLLAGTPVFGQTNPTGTLSGKVVDAQQLALPGATVTATSPALQGARTTTTTENGDFVLPFLPPGEYTVTVELAGFATVTRKERVRIGETTTIEIGMQLSSVSETVTVTGDKGSEFTTGAPVTTSFTQDRVEALPLSRTFTGTALLAPGVQGTGPSGNLMVNGAMSFESLYVVNGVVVNENLRGQPNTLFIEDALQETTVKTGSVSAEYGRFQGGVIEAITKSGGNDFHGSYRSTFDNDNWTALTPYPNDSRTDKLLLTHEATLGGPVLRDRLWFFTAGRFANRESTSTTAVTAIPFPVARDQERYEGKLTWAAVPGHSIKGAYTHIEDRENGNFFPPIMDLASLVNRKTPQDLLSMNYTGVLGSRFFLEGQYSRRQFTFEGSGSRYTDPIRGTLMLDQSRGNSRFWSPTFCGVCDDEKRDNQDIVAKATYFASTGSVGSHNVVAGFDMFDDKRFANNHQSGSDFRVFATSTILRGDQIFPVFDSRTIIQWNPILVGSQGNRFRTISGYINDAWTLDRHWTFNIGLRYDKNDGVDQTGAKTVKDGAFSPRLSASWDPRGDGATSINASFGRYVAGLTNSAGDSASSGGNPATFQFDYLGPAVNVGSPTDPLTTDRALEALWAWFNANGGTDRTPRGAPTVPGVNTRIDGRLSSPSSLEYVVGAAHRFGQRASIRVDGIFRDYRDFYSVRVDTSTGQVSDPFGRRFDMRVTGNTNDVERTYKAVNLQGQYTPGRRWTFGGNYTLSELRGNIEGENGPSGPVPANIELYPEYFDRSWAFPVGDLFGDSRHKARGWATWNLPTTEAVGQVTLGALQSFSSGSHYGASGPVNTRPYVTNPGYVTPPATVNYFFTARDAFKTADLWQTDLALNWAHNIGVKGAQVFFRGTVLNLFNRQELTNLFATCGTGGCINTTVLTNSNSPGLVPFNPFAETPVEGVHWQKSDSFGKPLTRFAYQTPRTWQFSVGVKF